MCEYEFVKKGITNPKDICKDPDTFIYTCNRGRTAEQHYILVRGEKSILFTDEEVCEITDHWDYIISMCNRERSLQYQYLYLKSGVILTFGEDTCMVEHRHCVIPFTLQHMKILMSEFKWIVHCM